MTSVQISVGDCIESMRDMPDCSVQCCVTSPPYWGLRDYGHEGQIGLEDTPEDYVERIVAVFREVRRVLRDDGTLWLNLGDSYAGTGKSGGGAQGERWVEAGADTVGPRGGKWKPAPVGLKSKDLIGIPWRVAFALQADGWWLRQDIIWHKPNPMPESVRDRCTKAHEYLFLLTKSARYYYDAESIKEQAVSDHPSGNGYKRGARKSYQNADGTPRGNEKQWTGVGGTRNCRSVWTITTKPYKGAHFAVMPPGLVEPCIKAGSREGDTVLDPFAGSGTTLAVAMELGRSAVGCELNSDYANLAKERIQSVKIKTPLFQGGSE